MPNHRPQNRRARRRWVLLQEVHELLDKPMVALAFVWLALLILEFTRGLSPRLLTLTYIIWAIFGLHFALEFLIAPNKLAYLRTKWLTAVALLLPAARVLRAFQGLRVLRAARAARSLSLLRLLATLNRGMRALGNALAERGIGYVIALTAIVLFAGAAGMRLFESPGALRQAGLTELAQQGAGLASYGEALWWTAMILTTMGSEYWPKTTEGRILAWLLSVYAFAIFGYIAGSIASYFIGQSPRGRSAAAQEQALAGLRQELAGLRTEIARLRRGA